MALRSSSPGTLPLIGRESELSSLLGAWDVARAGQGGFALISGEAGIGKTRLSEELVARVEAAGAFVSWGRCYEGEGAPPFWPWFQVLDALLKQPESARLDESITNFLAGVTSGAGGSTSARFLAREASGDYDRFQFFTACDQLISSFAAERPLLVIIEDLHWADPASLLVADFLARQGRLRAAPGLVVATYREPEAGSEAFGRALAGMVRGCVRVRLPLAGLVPADVGRLVEVARGEVTDQEAASIHAYTDGNPLFIRETLSLAEGAGGLQSLRSVPLPVGVEQAIAIRLGRLSLSCREAMGAAAVLGREFTLANLAAMTSITVDGLVEALDEAERSRVVTGLELPGTYRFSHNLVREVLYRGLAGGARMRLHERAGLALAAAIPTPGVPPHAEAAHHLREAAPLGQGGRAAHHFRLHAEWALTGFAYEAAEEASAAVVELRDQGNEVDQLDLAPALVTLGESRFRLGRRDEARAAFRDAMSIARGLMSAGSPDGATIFGRAALAFTGQELGFGSSDPEGIELLREALAAVPPGERALRLRIMASLGAWIHFAGRQDEAEALLNGALAEPVDPGTRSHILNSWHATLRNAANLPERLRVSTELRDIGLTRDDPEATIFGHRRRAMDFAEMGERQAMEAEFAAHDLLAQRLRQPIHSWHTTLWKGMTAFKAGDLANAERLAFEALQQGQQAGALNATSFFAAQLISVRREQGRAEELVPTLQGLVTSQPLLLAWRAALALVLSDCGRLEEARAVFDPIAGAGLASIPVDGQWGTLMYSLTDTCAALGGADAATEILAAIRPCLGTHVTAGNAAVYLGPLRLCAGILLGVMGENDQAATELARALAECEQMGAVLHAGMAKARLGGVLADADPGRSATLMREARVIAEECGSVRLRAVLDRHEGSRVPARTAALHLPAGLSAREVEVLRCLAAGRSNREIGEELFLSTNTVLRHITNIYRKIGASNRAEATLFAVRVGLGENPS